MWSTTNPVSKTDLHGSLRIVLSSNGIAIVQGANNLSVDRPLCLIGVPVNAIGVKSACWAVHIVVCTTIIGCCVAFTEVVTLDMGSITADYFPVNLIQIVRDEDKTADDPSTWRSLHSTFDLAKEEVPV